MNQSITLTVNGRTRTVVTPPDRLLLDVLREDLQLTGTKYGCGEGRCGACTVLVDGRNMHSCQVRAAEVQGKSIVTIEGLARGGSLHPVQQAFLAEGRRAVRLLHAGYDPYGGGPAGEAPPSQRRADPGLDERQLMPLQRLCKDPARRAACRGPDRGG